MFRKNLGIGGRLNVKGKERESQINSSVQSWKFWAKVKELVMAS